MSKVTKNSPQVFASWRTGLIDQLECDFCQCGAEINRDKPKTWEWCAIHKICDQLRSHVEALEEAVACTSPTAP